MKASGGNQRSNLGDLVPFSVTPRIAMTRIKREAVEEARNLYRDTDGFAYPLPPNDPELRAMWEAGEIEEMPWE